MPSSPGPRDALYVSSTGAYTLGHRIDRYWVRASSEMIPLADFPLQAGASWRSRDTWREESLVALPSNIARPTAATVEETTKIESLKDLVTVPAGSYRDCVRITRDQVIVENTGARERRTVTTYYAAGVGAVKKASEVSRASGVTRATWELRRVQWVR